MVLNYAKYFFIWLFAAAALAGIAVAPDYIARAANPLYIAHFHANTFVYLALFCGAFSFVKSRVVFALFFLFAWGSTT